MPSDLSGINNSGLHQRLIKTRLSDASREPDNGSFSGVVMQPPKRRTLGVPLLLIFVAIAIIAMTVLLANDGRNILALAKALNIDLTFGRKIAPTPAVAIPEPVGKPAWPWLASVANERIAVQMSRPAAELCESTGQDGQEKPALVTHDSGNWECSSLKEYAEPEGGSSLFFQIRALADGSFLSFRTKFNLDTKGMTPELGNEASRLMGIALRPLAASGEMEDALKQKLQSQTDFYYLMGYYPIVFKREISDITRFNMIVFNRPAPVTDLSTRGFAPITLPPPERGGSIKKGPRLVITDPAAP